MTKLTFPPSYPLKMTFQALVALNSKEAPSSLSMTRFMGVGLGCWGTVGVGLLSAGTTAVCGEGATGSEGSRGAAGNSEGPETLLRFMPNACESFGYRDSGIFFWI